MYRVFLTLVVSLSFVACGGGSKSDPAPVPAPAPEPVQQTGVFLDSPVANIDYVTETLSGVTNEQGEFNYIEGEKISFKIGDLAFPAVKATTIVTPEDFSINKDAHESVVRNTLRLLQSLDVDGNPENGIEISDKAKLYGKPVDFKQAVENFEKNADILALIQNGDQQQPITELVNEYLAFLHFAKQKARFSKFKASDVEGKTFYWIDYYSYFDTKQRVSKVTFTKDKVKSSFNGIDQVSDYKINENGQITYSEKIETTVLGVPSEIINLDKMMVKHDGNDKFLSVCLLRVNSAPYCSYLNRVRFFSTKDDVIKYDKSMFSVGFGLSSLSGRKIFLASMSRYRTESNNDFEFYFNGDKVSFSSLLFTSNKYRSKDYFATNETLKAIKSGSYIVNNDVEKKEISTYQKISNSHIKLNDFRYSRYKGSETGLNLRLIKKVAEGDFIICIDEKVSGFCETDKFYRMFFNKQDADNFKVSFNSSYRDLDAETYLKNAFFEKKLQGKTYYAHIVSGTSDASDCPSKKGDYLESYTFENGMVVFKNCKDEVLNGSYSVTPLGFLKMKFNDYEVYFKRTGLFGLPLPKLQADKEDFKDSKVCRASSLEKVKACSGGSVFYSDYNVVKKIIDEANK